MFNIWLIDGAYHITTDKQEDDMGGIGGGTLVVSIDNEQDTKDLVRILDSLAVRNLTIQVIYLNDDTAPLFTI